MKIGKVKRGMYMKKYFINIIFSMLLVVTMFSLAGCFGGSGPKDYNADIQVVAPENIATEHFVVEEGVTYYTSPGFSLSMSVRGHFMIMDYFSLDGDKRVYDNIYFYEDDYFYIVTSDYVDLFASLEEEADKQYAEEEKESGYDIQINIIKSGIYKLIFNTTTLKFDLVYKSEIETPRYYTIKNCDIYSVATDWVVMSVNPENNEEFYVTNFNVETGKLVSFFSHIHTSNYVPTLESASEKYTTIRNANIFIKIGGTYNIYINSKTYEVRFELVNVETADYTCIYYDGSQFITLQLVDPNVPYVFTYEIDVDTKFEFVPKFYTEHYYQHSLEVVDSPNISKNGEYAYLKDIGRYKLTINLKTFQLSAELLPE